ncbi:unnamed protein product, partial [Rotaria magnacalcarata]
MHNRHRSWSHSSSGGSGSIVLMQPKLEPQPVVFDQHQQQQ